MFFIRQSKTHFYCKWPWHCKIFFVWHQLNSRNNKIGQGRKRRGIEVYNDFRVLRPPSYPLSYIGHNSPCNIWSSIFMLWPLNFWGKIYDVKILVISWFRGMASHVTSIHLYLITATRWAKAIKHNLNCCLTIKRQKQLR